LTMKVVGLILLCLCTHTFGAPVSAPLRGGKKQTVKYSRVVRTFNS
jgi:hypothetical protein